MKLPPSHEVVAAAAQAELLSVNALVGMPLPPLRRPPLRRPPFDGTTPGTDRRMHVVYLMPRTGVGGGARVLLEHANHLTALGVAVTVMSHHPRPSWFPLRAEFLEVPFGQRLDRSIPACDLIVAGYWTQVLPARHLGIAPVVHFEQGDFHLYDEVGAGMRALIQASLQAADWTITVGEAARQALLDRYGVVAERIPNAVDPELFHPQIPAQDRRQVIFVGWDGTPFKGIDVARAVAAGLRASHPDVALVWVTPAPPVGDAFADVVVSPTQVDLAQRYRESSVYIGTSRYESFPLPPLEAMASGVAVVSTANDGVCTYARDGDNCLLAPVDDVDGLLAAARRTLDDKELAASLRRRGLATAQAYSWPQIITDLLARYRQVIADATAGDGDGEPGEVSADPYSVELDGLEFRDQADRRQLGELLDRCPYREVAIPVSRPAVLGYRLVRWEVVARRIGGVPGQARLHRLACSDVAVEDATYQFGVDLLRENLADEAFSWFSDQARQSAGAEQAVLGRWILVSLIAAGRFGDAAALAEKFAAEYPANADLSLLGWGAAQAASDPVDARSAAESRRLLGSAALFSEWFDGGTSGGGSGSCRTGGSGTGG